MNKMSMTCLFTLNHKIRISEIGWTEQGAGLIFYTSLALKLA